VGTRSTLHGSDLSEFECNLQADLDGYSQRNRRFLIATVNLQLYVIYITFFCRERTWHLEADYITLSVGVITLAAYALYGGAFMSEVC
jgi:uncharacterized membrane protein